MVIFFNSANTHKKACKAMSLKLLQDRQFAMFYQLANYVQCIPIFTITIKIHHSNLEKEPRT